MELTSGPSPLPRTRRRFVFLSLVGLFAVILPFLYLYATGYRFDLGEDIPFIGTGGIYVSADRTGAEIYIDDELVRETRTFRKAFYAQGIEPGVHLIYVQKTGHHTWVKELPVYAHLVTEALAFNMPEVPRVRVISPWKTRAGETVIGATSTLLATTTNTLAVSDRVLTTFVADTEYATLVQLFTATTTTEGQTTVGKVADEVASFLSNTSATKATSTKETGGVRLYANEGDIFAAWIGPREQMPYYYCAEAFELSTSSAAYADKEREDDEVLIGPVQYIPEATVCEPVIMLDRKDEEVTAFDFYPGSTDLVLIARESGVYVTEVDDRAWQNVQPLLLGEGFDMRVENGNVYVYDGTLIFHVLVES